MLEQRPQSLARAAQGDLDSYSVLIDPLLDPAYWLAAVMLGDRSPAEDAVQEASIKAWRNLRQLRGDSHSLKAWFLSIGAHPAPRCATGSGRRSPKLRKPAVPTGSGRR